MKTKMRLIWAGIIVIVFAVFIALNFDVVYETVMLLTNNPTYRSILQYPNSTWESDDGKLKVTVGSPGEYAPANFALLTYNDGEQIHRYGIVSTTYGVCYVIDEADEEEASCFFGSNFPPNIGTIRIFSENDGYIVIGFSDDNTLPPYYDEKVWPWERFIRFYRVDE